MKIFFLQSQEDQRDLQGTSGYTLNHEASDYVIGSQHLKGLIVSQLFFFFTQLSYTKSSQDLYDDRYIQKMQKNHRDSFGNSIQNAIESQHNTSNSQGNNIESQNTAKDMKPTMHQILRKYLRKSTQMGLVKETFKHFSSLELKEGFKKSSPLQESPKQVNHEEKLALNIMKAVSITKMGIRNYDSMENQDVVMEDIVCQNFRIYGIFDGHGQYGRDIAITAKTIFQGFIKKNLENLKYENTNEPKESIIRKIIQKTNAYLLHYKASECEFSGTTALIIAITKTTIYVFNIGNSRLIMGKQYKEDEKIGAFQITHDHTLQRFDERLRVTKTEAEITQYKNQKGEFIGPERIWAPKQKYPGMIITRTLGLSCSYPLGVITQPEVSVIHYNQTFKFLVMASDGLWRVLTNDEAVELILKYNSYQFQVAINALLFEAIQRWRDSKDLMDDISLIIVPLIKQ